MNPWIPHLLRAAGRGSTLPSSGQTFYASLKTSLVPEVGTGGPTWSRATAAWRFNDLGYLRQIPSGCAEFGGARLVTNLCPTPSNTLAVAGTKTVTLTAAATLQFSMGAGTGTATFSGTGGATGTLAAGASRVSVNKTVTAGTFVVTASVADLVDLSIVDVTGRDASYVPEYVSVGALSAPYHGAGVDGSKYFATDWQGAPIPVANLTRLRKESSATNALLSSRNLSQHHGSSFATKRWQVSETTGSELLANNSFDSGLTSWTTTIGSGGTISATGGQCTFISDGGTVTSMSNTYQLVAGESYVFTMVASGSGTIKLSNNTVEITGFGSGTSTISFVAGSTKNFLLSRSSGVACNLVIDSVSIKLAAVKTEQTATGLDGIANSASTVTSRATDVIILQSIVLASAARCASTYVRRKTGTGTISFTQDGGSTWTDITSQLNSTTFSRVQITATLANPSVGFKIATSGDAIEVDCVQNEAGSVATSPIVTTTATVTRNADVLTYQTSGNIDFTAGTIFSQCRLYGMTTGSAQQIIRVSTNGYMHVNNGDASTSIRAFDGVTVVTKTGLDDITSKMAKRAVAWGGSAMVVSGNGLVSTPASFDGGFGDGVSITIGNAILGYVGDVAIYNYKMTDAELQAITT